VINPQQKLPKEINPNNLIDLAMLFAIQAHQETNHTYAGKPYSVHLQLAFSFASKHIESLPTEINTDEVLAVVWVHDVIEDCRKTFSDVKKALGDSVAEIVFALTNENGKTRKERASEKYYEGIRKTPGAVFVNLCDQLANVQYSKDNRNSMLAVYKKEQADFKQQLWVDAYATMFEELDELLCE
jgi:(p)ppGpp synthase/HD superfamily hydrolase